MYVVLVILDRLESDFENLEISASLGSLSFGSRFDFVVVDLLETK